MPDRNNITCIWCGSPGLGIVSRYMRNSVSRFGVAVKCPDCDATGPVSDTAVNAWSAWTRLQKELDAARDNTTTSQA